MDRVFHPAAAAFVERMGLISELEGLPRIAGRIMGYLMLDAEPRSLDDIAEHLQVSKASVSTNTRILESMGMLERYAAPGDRRDYYRIHDCPWENALISAQRRFTRMIEVLETSSAELPEEMTTARERLNTWRNFYAFLLEEMNQKVRAWRLQHTNGQTKATEIKH